MGAGVTRFLAAVTISMYGDWLTTVAMMVLLFRITGSAAAPAGYVLVRVAPRVFGAGPGGALADRHSPVTVLASSWVAQGALTAALVPLSQTGSLVGIYVCVGASQFLKAFSAPSIGAIIPRLGERGHIAPINRFYAAADNSSMFVAPLIGSALLLLGSVNTVLLIDASTFLLGALAIASIKLAPRDAVPSTGVKAASRLAGMSTALGDPVLRTVLATCFASGMVATTLQAVLVVAAAERLGNASQVGWLYSAVGVGGLMGTVVVASWRPPSLSATVLGAIGAAELVALVLFALVPVPGVAVALLGGSSVAGVVAETWGTIHLQERVQIHLLGRVNAAVHSALFAGMLVGAICGLTLTQAVRWETTITVVGGLALVLVFVAVATGRAKRLAVLSAQTALS